jgi:predicted ATP-dependent endonuclease of OLD family
MQKDSLEDLLPEYSIGLGYQNLQSLSYQLVSFKAARLNPEKGAPAPVHLVMIEEPEAHLHVQVQRIFPGKAHKLISPNGSNESGLKSQLIISTHSSHLAHAENFDRLRYVRRIAKSEEQNMPTTEVVNLGQVFGDDKTTRQFAERYFRVQHTDLYLPMLQSLSRGLLSECCYHFSLKEILQHSTVAICPSLILVAAMLIG